MHKTTHTCIYFFLFKNSKSVTLTDMHKNPFFMTMICNWNTNHTGRLQKLLISLEETQAHGEIEDATKVCLQNLYFIPECICITIQYLIAIYIVSPQRTLSTVPFHIRHSWLHKERVTSHFPTLSLLNVCHINYLLHTLQIKLWTESYQFSPYRSIHCMR